MTTFEKIMRAQFEAWRAIMDRDGEHLHDLQTFESLGPNERRFAISMTRVAVEAIRERLLGTVCEPVLDTILSEIPDA